MKIKKTKRVFDICRAVLIAAALSAVCLCAVDTEPVEASFKSTTLKNFPKSYWKALRALHKKYPDWQFVAYNTGISFRKAVNNEALDDRSLMSTSAQELLKSNADGDYDTSSGTYIAKDGSTWVTASKNCIAYFMDPRNFLDEDHIYMFEKLSYDSTQVRAGIEKILYGSFMYKTNIGYIDTSKAYVSTSTRYSKAIRQAAKQSGVSAYYLASKIIQEIGTSASSQYAGMGASGSVSGIYSDDYIGIYNFYNIGASSGSNPILNGLSWASSGSTYLRPWTTPLLSISGGALYIGEQYINGGQHTSYFQRFNVNSDGDYDLYTHQYMTNIYGAANEALSTSYAYESIGMTSDTKVFVIPVYKNMPKKKGSVSISLGKKSKTKKPGVISSSVNVRSSASTDGEILTTLSAGTEVTVIRGVINSSAYSSKWLANPYWYRIKYKDSNGKTCKGYVASDYVELDVEYKMKAKTSRVIPVSVTEGEKVYYRSSDPSIATVGGKGKVKAKKKGYVTIYAITSTGKFSAVRIKVRKADS